MPVISAIRKAPAPRTGGVICPPVDEVASIAAAVGLSYQSLRIIGMVTMPEATTLATADPEIDPNRMPDATAAFAGPPLAQPNIALHKSLM
jgi:hypothetical protein